ncbi:MAG: transcriptional repressor LexA [Thermodesulfovibrionales bacterium]
MEDGIQDSILRSRIDELKNFYRSQGRMPSLSEVGEIVGFRSKNASHKFINKLIRLDILERDAKGRLIPKSMAASLRVLGTVEAGFPAAAEQMLADTLCLDDLLVRHPDSTFMLQVSGESMSGAGILPGDMVIVDKDRGPKQGDIVIAEVDGAWTMKYLEIQGDDITLLPANPAFTPIRPLHELKIAGVVTAVIRKY